MKETNDAEGLEGQRATTAGGWPGGGPPHDLDGYTVTFTSLLEDIDATPFMKGPPDDRCRCPHWGYVIKGRMTARYADRDEGRKCTERWCWSGGRAPHRGRCSFRQIAPPYRAKGATALMFKLSGGETSRSPRNADDRLRPSQVRERWLSGQKREAMNAITPIATSAASAITMAETLPPVKAVEPGPAPFTTVSDLGLGG
ncbi:MAG: hypothetical protein WBM72_13090 [Actinomycetota bacterium]